METNGSILNRDDMEKRRLEAAGDFMNGLSQSKVARKFGVSRTTASRWHRMIMEKGPESLRKRRATGRPCRLTTEQMRLIPELYGQGASRHGFDDDRWTTARLAVVIERRFGVRYDQDHVGRLMHKLGLRETVRRGRPQHFVAPAAYYPHVSGQSVSRMA